MATLLAHIEVHTGRERAFEAVAKELYQATHARESGCRRYEYWRAAAPGHYYCLLAFDDFNAFLDHQTSAHHEAAGAKLGELIANLRLEWVDPVVGASELPLTRMQPVVRDADSPRRRAHQTYAATLQEWWHALRAD